MPCISWGTSIRRPGWRPRWTWTARNWPRLTRCKTVCRETPKAFIASPHHYANIVEPAFTRVAIGVVKSGQLYWVTESFVG